MTPSRYIKRPTLIAVVLLASAAPAPAQAERPTDGRYATQCCDGALFAGYALIAQLRVTDDGRRLRGGPAGSYVGCDRDGTVLKLTRRRGVAIRADGSFAFRSRRRGFAYTVRGRFDRPDTARIRYRVRARASSFGCPTGPRRLRLHRAIADPPFAGCATQAGRTLASTSGARVFSQRRVFPRGWAFAPFTYACLKPDGRRVALGWDGTVGSGLLGQDLGPFRLAGPRVAYGCGGNVMNGCWSSVFVIDLRDGSVLHRVNLPLALAGVFGRGVRPSGVELSETGSVGWLAGGEPLLGQVGIRNAGGTKVLDEGKGIERGSLALTGTTLTWRNDGQLRSATLE